ncbi:MAG: hypothetical protein AAF216_11730 [Pseudomonadota bacterium]
MSSTSHANVNDNPAFSVIGAVIVWSADDGGTAPVVADFVIDTGAGTSAATSGDTDLIGGDTHTVVTGTLVSTLGGPNSAGTMPFRIEDATNGNFVTDSNNDGIANASDSFSAFDVNADTSVAVDGTTSSSSFYVASNVPFSIDAQSQVSPGTSFIFLFITTLEMSVTLDGDDGLDFGSAAQFPHSAGATGGMTPAATLWSLFGGRNVFTGNQRTAASRGSISDQSVRFDLEYSIGAGNLQGYDMSLGTFDFEADVTYTVYIP